MTCDGPTCYQWASLVPPIMPLPLRIFAHSPNDDPHDDDDDNANYDDDEDDDDYYDDDLDAIVEITALLGVILLKLRLTSITPPQAKNLQPNKRR